jgi:hypothetical protein
MAGWGSALLWLVARRRRARRREMNIKSCPPPLVASE